MLMYILGIWMCQSKIVEIWDADINLQQIFSDLFVHILEECYGRITISSFLPTLHWISYDIEISIEILLLKISPIGTTSNITCFWCREECTYSNWWTFTQPVECHYFGAHSSKQLPSVGSLVERKCMTASSKWSDLESTGIGIFAGWRLDLHLWS